MKVLLCTSELQYSNSSAAIRNRILLCGLTEIATVDVIEFRQNSKLDASCNENINKHILLDDFLKTTTSVTTNVTSKESVKSKIKKALKPYIPDIFYLKKVNLTADVNFNDYDFVISSSEPKGLHNLILNNIKQYKNKQFKYIQYWGDPWFDDIARPTNTVTFWLEKQLLSRADHVIYNSARTLARQKKLFNDIAERMYFLPRGIISNTEKGFPVIEVNAERKSRLLYAGDFRGSYRNIQPLAEVCSDMQVDLVVAGNGDIQTESLNDCIQVLGRISTEELQEKIAETDIDVVILNSEGGQLPGKVYDVIQSNRPVIVILDGEFSPTDVPCQSRFIFASNDRQSIQDVLENISSGEQSFEFDNSEMTSLNIKELVPQLFKKLRE